MNQGDHYDSREVAGIVLYSFLESSSDITFASTLCSLKKQLLAPKQPSVYDDGELQTDGNNFGRVENRALGARLAVIGDKLAAEIEHPFVNNLAQQFMVENVSSQVITHHLSEAVRNVVARMPPEMEQEKAMLVAAMILAKKVANVVPALLQQVFDTTVNYINQNLHDYDTHNRKFRNQKYIHMKETRISVAFSPNGSSRKEKLFTSSGSIATCCHDSGPSETGKLSVCQLWLADRETARGIGNTGSAQLAVPEVLIVVTQ
ncbi:hypothetical protein E2320_004271 [Naja naja]|nr:hypothetical protein E2320_004271 [Naja naja]